MARKSAQGQIRTAVRASTRTQRNGVFQKWRLFYDPADVYEVSASATAGTNTAPPVRRSQRQAKASPPRSQTPQAHDNDKEYVDTHTTTDNSSVLSTVQSTFQSSPEPKSAQAPVFAETHKSPLVLQQEQEDKKKQKKQVKAEKQAAKRGAEAKRHAMKEAAEAPTNMTGQTKIEMEKLQKLQMLAELFQRDRIAPRPWELQLSHLPPRQNITGRALPLKVLSADDTLPSTDDERACFVAVLIDAMRDVRSAEDAVSPTSDFWYVWLKPSFAGEYSYSELDMEWVCRKLVSIAEGLHNHGLGATEIFCPLTIKKAQAAAALSFEDRIGKLATLMRKSKARCDLFMLNNTLEDTIALIGQKVTAQVSNGKNNKRRSDKLFHSNHLLGLKKGDRWALDQDGNHTRGSKSEPGYGTPESMVAGNSVAEVDENDEADHGEDLHRESQLLPWLTEEERIRPVEQAEVAPYYTEPSESPQFGFDDFQRHIPQPPIHPPYGYSRLDDCDLASANKSFDAMFASHHGIQMPREDDEAHVPQSSYFYSDHGDDEDFEFAPRKRPHEEQVEDVSVNSLLRGKTAKISSGSGNKTRR